MSIQNLTTETMLALTERWLTPAGGRTILEARAATRALIPRLEAARAALRAALDAMAAAVGSAAVARTLAERAARASELDAVHDRKARGVYAVLSALIDLSDGAADVRAFSELRARLFPHGMAITGWHYDAEVANAREVSARLDAATRAALDAIRVAHHGRQSTLATHVDAWLAAAAELGLVTAERGPGLDAGAAAAPSAQQVATRARGAWVSAVFGLIAELTVDGGASEAEVELVLGALRDAEEAADQRVGGGAPQSLPSSGSA